MSPDAGLAWYRLGVFLVMMSILLLPFQRRDSAEFVILVLTLTAGLLVLGIVALIVKIFNR